MESRSKNFREVLKENYHLVGTTDDCDEYYKTWK